jgi:hypothetical protein
VCLLGDGIHQIMRKCRLRFYCQDQNLHVPSKIRRRKPSRCNHCNRRHTRTRAATHIPKVSCDHRIKTVAMPWRPYEDAAQPLPPCRRSD